MARTRTKPVPPPPAPAPDDAQSITDLLRAAQAAAVRLTGAQEDAVYYKAQLAKVEAELEAAECAECEYCAVPDPRVEAYEAVLLSLGYSRMDLETIVDSGTPELDARNLRHANARSVRNGKVLRLVLS